MKPLTWETASETFLITLLSDILHVLQNTMQETAALRLIQLLYVHMYMVLSYNTFRAVDFFLPKENNSVLMLWTLSPSLLFFKVLHPDVCVPEILIREQQFVRKGSTGAAHIPDSFKHISSPDTHNAHTQCKTMSGFNSDLKRPRWIFRDSNSVLWCCAVLWKSEFNGCRADSQINSCNKTRQTASCN